MKTIQISLKGVAPLIMHNGQLADPLSGFVKASASFRGKRKKVAADHEELGRLEFLGALYVNERQKPVLPGYVLEAVAIAGAKKSREGLVAKAALFIEEDAELEYDGPKDPDALYEDKRFVHRSMVRIATSKTPRVRPIFKQWEVTFTATVDDDIVSPDAVRNWFETAGHQIGIGDWRPRHGRFEVTRFDIEEALVPAQLKARHGSAW